MFLVPALCTACGRPGSALCPRCRAALTAALPVDGIDGVERCRALVEYDRTGRALVAGLKFRNRRALITELGRLLSALVEPDSSDLVTWVPTTAARRRMRGYDQARLLARAVAAPLGLRVSDTLSRVSSTHQTGRGRVERFSGVELEVRIGGRPSIVGARVLVVDDVVTTGASLRAAAGALRRAGAASVSAAILARTPLKVAAHPTDDN